MHKKKLYIFFHIIIGKNNNVNLADFGAKFTIMSNSLYITVVNIANVHVHVYSCIEQKLVKLYINFQGEISSFDD